MTPSLVSATKYTSQSSCYCEAENCQNVKMAPKYLMFLLYGRNDCILSADVTDTGTRED